MQRLDNYTKLQTQIRKNFEVFVESEMQREQDEISSDSEDEQIFNGSTFKLFDGTKYVELPKALLELETLQNLIDGEQFTSLFTLVDQQHLYSFLPVQLNQDQKETAMKQLLSGESMHFGSPLDTFLGQCKSGQFTKNAKHCSAMDYELATLRCQETQQSMARYFTQPDHKEQVRQRMRASMFRQFSPCSSISGESCEKKVRINESEDSVSTTSSQSYSAPQYIPQQATSSINMALQFPNSSQSLFATTPITTLPQYTSTSLLTNQMTLAYLQARKQFKKPGGGTGGQSSHANSKLKLESTVPTGQSDRHWLEGFWKQEIDRYKNPLVAYTFNCIDGSKATVAPAAKKLLSGMSSKPRQHELLKNERPPYVTILSLVRDAAARLPKGYGTRADIMNLVKDSQFINENLPDEKMSSIISGALDRLHQSTDPCVKYDQEKKIWIYLHHDRDQTYPDWQVAMPISMPSKPKKNKEMK